MISAACASASPLELLGDALRAVGVNAISMPVPQIPEALAQGVIDGCVLVGRRCRHWKIHELVKFRTKIPGIRDG